MARAEATLPSGRRIVMKEISGQEERLAITEASVVGGEATIGQAIVGTWGMALRAILQLDPREGPFEGPVPSFDQTRYDATSIRDEFSKTDFDCALELYNKLNSASKEEQAAFRSSIKLST